MSSEAPCFGPNVNIYDVILYVYDVPNKIELNWIELIKVGIWMPNIEPNHETGNSRAWNGAEKVH